MLSIHFERYLFLQLLFITFASLLRSMRKRFFWSLFLQIYISWQKFPWFSTSRDRFSLRFHLLRWGFHLSQVEFLSTTSEGKKKKKRRRREGKRESRIVRLILFLRHLFDFFHHWVILLDIFYLDPFHLETFFYHILLILPEYQLHRL